MTNAEYKAIHTLYLKLLEKQERTEYENLQYKYCDAIISYVEIRKTAIQMGNKNPDDNFVVANARERMLKAEMKLREYKLKTPVKN